MMGLRPCEAALASCAAGLVLLTLVMLTLPQPAMGQFGIGYGPALHRFVFAGCLQGLIYGIAVAVILRADPPPRSFWFIIGAAIVLRLLALAVPPFLSNDIYRYIWDGRVQAAGINPYRYIPADPHLAFLRDAEIFPNINRANYAHTIYPPAAEIFFAAATRLGALLALPPVFAMKLAMVGAEAAGIWAIIRLLGDAGLPRQRILIYAWNPLPVWEFAGTGHVDAIAIGLIGLALLAACQSRRAWSAAALAGAVLTKFLPVVLLPAIWRRWDWRFAAVFTALIMLLYAPYLGVGRGVFGFLGGYNAQEGIDSGAGLFPFAVIGRVIPLPVVAAKLYLALLAAILAGISLLILRQPALPALPAASARTICGRALLLGMVLMAGISPHYPWYYCWLLLPACILPLASTLYLVTASFMLYLNPVHTNLSWPALVYGPFAAFAVFDVWWRMKSPATRHPAAPQGATR